MHDLKIAGGSVVSVETGEIWRTDVIVDGDAITALVEPGADWPAREEISAEGLLVVPGFIDAHVHVESSMLTPVTFAQGTLAKGTTTVLADPHEIVNVAGIPALKWMIEQGATTLQSMFWAVPSCVPSLDGLETAGATLSPSDIDEALRLPGVIALGEVMDYRAVVSGASRMHEILSVAREHDVVIDGHCPDLVDDELQRYLAAGVDSDHCKNHAESVRQKLRLGMTLMLQEKSFTDEVMSVFESLPRIPDVCIVTDDIAADVIAKHGHLDHVARVARAAGMPALSVLRALTVNPARRLRLHDRGVIAPGRRADVVLVKDLDTFEVAGVVVGGAPLGQSHQSQSVSKNFIDSVQVDHSLLSGLVWKVDLPDGEYAFRALRVNNIDTFTREDHIVLPVRKGVVEWEGRCARVSVVERHTASGRVAHAPVLGMDLGTGAVCTSYSHDSHNLTVIATSNQYADRALQRVIELSGGIVVRTDTGDAELALPLGGVMTDASLEDVADSTSRIRAVLERWGWSHRIPFMSISTLTLPVSPALKISDYGLISVLDRVLVPATLTESSE